MASSVKDHTMEFPNVSHWREAFESFLGKTILIGGSLYTIYKAGKHSITSLRAAWRKLARIGDALETLTAIKAEVEFLRQRDKISFEASFAPQWIADATGACIAANSAYCSLVGMSESEMLGTGWRTAIHPSDESEVVAEWSAAVATGAPFHSVFRLRGKGQTFKVRVRAFPTLERGKVQWYGITNVVEAKPETKP